MKQLKNIKIGQIEALKNSEHYKEFLEECGINSKRR